MVESKNIKNLAIEDRPREKLRKIGSENLSDKELLAIMLRTGTKNMNVIDLADKILKDLGGVSNLKNTTFNELVKHKGIGEVKAIDILASLEFAKRIFANETPNKITCKNPEIIANYVRYKLQDLKQEVFIVLDLDTKGKIIEEREVFRGSLQTSVVHPREIFKNSIRNSSASVVCIHNHPSGDATPSLADIKTTQILFEAGDILGIEVLDHIIVAKNGFASLTRILNHLKREKICIDELTKLKLQELVTKYKFVDGYGK